MEPQKTLNSLFNKRFWENWISICTRMKLDTYLTPLTKVNSKWIKDLNLRPETIKLLKENIGENLLNICLGNDFKDMTPKSQAIKVKINRSDNIKLKSSAQQKKQSTK